MASNQSDRALENKHRISSVNIYDVRMTLPQNFYSFAACRMSLVESFNYANNLKKIISLAKKGRRGWLKLKAMASSFVPKDREELLLRTPLTFGFSAPTDMYQPRNSRDVRKNTL